MPRTLFQNPAYMVVPSLSCQASCKYCFGPNNGKIMGLTEVHRTIDYIKQFSDEIKQNTVDVAIHGGEPLCAGHEIIRAFVEGLSDAFSGKQLRISIQSNLWALDEAYCQLFKDYHVFIGTSLDGPKEICDRQRGDGYFQRTMAGIRLAGKFGLKVGCIATFTRQSQEDWQTVYDFFHKQKLSFDIHGAVAAGTAQNEWTLSEDAYKNLFQFIIDDYESKASLMRLPVIDHLCRGIYRNHNSLCTFRDCFGMFIVVDPHGDLYPCQRFIGHLIARMGNITDIPDPASLADSQAGQLMMARSRHIEESCGDCEHLSYCRGGCTFNAYTAGNISGKDYLCEAYKDIFAHLKTAMERELTTDKNINSILEYGPNEEGNPFYKTGTYLEIAGGNHPNKLKKQCNAIKKIISLYAFSAILSSEFVSRA